MSHRRVKKRTGATAGAGAVVVAAAAIVLPNASASWNEPAGAGPRTLTFASAAQLGSTLAADLGADAAGWYFDDGDDRLVMNVLDEEAARAAESRGARAVIVENSMAELKAVTRTLGDTASIPGTAWSIDPRTNKVVVLADRTVTGERMAALRQATGALDGTVTVKRSAGEFRPFTGNRDGVGRGEDGRGGDGFGENGFGDDDSRGNGTGGGGTGSVTGGNETGGATGGGGGAEGAGGVDGGDAIFGGGSRCSLGFNVTLDGVPAFLTAGHCGNASRTWTADARGGAPLGTVVASRFPVSDFALVVYDDPAAPAPGTVDLKDGTVQEITRVAEASVGMRVQRSGSTTGLSAGTVTGLNATVNYGNGDIVNGLIQTDVCAEPGDSGGAMFSGDAAVGLTSGGSGDCTRGGETFFQPVTTALEVTGAQLGAGGGGGGADGGIEDGGAEAPAGNGFRDPRRN
ncbi:S1 family peptidase [Streptomyces sp. TRM 70361]|uniref:S1 family peptidase n=1 Tax=Streptomyces sp. TRM 70361 TaxID=3116553 RepID=UPI002E7BFE72|nr:S1 family peptidase [Streptomyces sp. TRM 70361]MEE1940269.1 S1 family peptidase [Streptomyces sp. TRM 70361]